MKSIGRRVVNANRMKATSQPVEDTPVSRRPALLTPQGSFPDLRADTPKSTEESLQKTKDVPPEERLQYREPSLSDMKDIHEGGVPQPVGPSQVVQEGVPEGEHPPTSLPQRDQGYYKDNIFDMGTREERDRLTYEIVSGAGSVEPALLLQSNEAEIWVIAGAERSLGLQFVEQALTQGNAVIALCQNQDLIGETYELRDLISKYSTRSCIVPCDFLLPDSMLAAAIEIKRLCGSHAVDVFINAEGGAYDGAMDIMKCTAEDMMHVFDLEVIGPLYFLQNVMPFMESAANPRVVLLSSIVGSNFNVQRDYRSKAAPFCTAKAAVNMLATCFRAEMPEAQVTVAALHPGWASTKEGITPETNKQPPTALVDCVHKCMRTINHLDEERHGLFIDYQGSQLRY